MIQAFDIRYAWRLATRSWGYSLLCLLVVGLSLGLALWAYALVYTQSLKPLPFPGSENWYSIQIVSDAGSNPNPIVDEYTYRQILLNVDADHLGAYASRSALVTAGEGSVSLRAAEISPSLLAATSAQPLLGRLFDESDTDIDGAASVVLSHETWINYFAGDLQIVGAQIMLDSEPATVIGVMPEKFFAFSDFEIWVPLRSRPLVRAQPTDRRMAPYIAQRNGQAIEEVRSSMQSVVQRVNQDYPNLFKSGRHVELIKGRLAATHHLLPVITVISLLALAILLLGCVNIGLVFFARLLERSRELALRSALGSSRQGLLQQSLVETGLIVAAGLLVGTVLAFFGIRWAEGVGNFNAQILALGREPNPMTLRATDLIVGVLVAVFVWLLSTLVPALRISKQDTASALASTGKGAAIRGGTWTTNLIVGFQVLISSVVLVVAGNLVVAVSKETNKPLGIDTNNTIITTRATSFTDRYNEPGDRLEYLDRLRERILTRMPGSQVAYASTAPTRPVWMSAALDEQRGREQGLFDLPFATVSDEYFGVLGVQIRSGRLFDRTDERDSMPVVVIDEKTAARYWPNESAINKRIQVNPIENGPWLTVVGVVSAVRGEVYRPDIGVVYRSMRQVAPESFRTMVKLPHPDPTAGFALRAAAFEIDHGLALNNPQSLKDYIAVISLGYKSMVKVLIVITLITSLLAASGLFGLISRSVAQRTQEVGIRRALGATRWRAVSMFFRRGGVYLTIGLVGLVLGVILTNLLGTEFSNALDHAVVVTSLVFLLMVVVVAVAVAVPTSRAARLEPGDALRHE